MKLLTHPDKNNNDRSLDLLIDRLFDRLEGLVHVFCPNPGEPFSDTAKRNRELFIAGDKLKFEDFLAHIEDPKESIVQIRNLSVKVKGLIGQLLSFRNHLESHGVSRAEIDRLQHAMFELGQLIRGDLVAFDSCNLGVLYRWNPFLFHTFQALAYEFMVPKTRRLVQSYLPEVKNEVESMGATIANFIQHSPRIRPEDERWRKIPLMPEGLLTAISDLNAGQWENEPEIQLLWDVVRTTFFEVDDHNEFGFRARLYKSASNKGELPALRKYSIDLIEFFSTLSNETRNRLLNNKGMEDSESKRCPAFKHRIDQVLKQLGDEDLGKLRLMLVDQRYHLTGSYQNSLIVGELARMAVYRAVYEIEAGQDWCSSWHGPTLFQRDPESYYKKRYSPSNYSPESLGLSPISDKRLKDEISIGLSFLLLGLSLHVTSNNNKQETK